MLKDTIKNTIKEIISGEILDKYLNKNLSRGKVVEKYLVDGISVYLDYNICNANRNILKKSRRNEIPQLLEAIRNLPYCIKKALAERGVPIILNDMETVRVVRNSSTVVGYYSMKTDSVSEIHVGLSNSAYSITTLFHEIGHFIDEEVGILRCTFESYYTNNKDDFYSDRNLLVTKAFNREVSMFRDYASTDTAEFVAVVFEEYLSGKVLDEAIETKEVIDMYMTALKCEYEAGQYRGTMKTK